MLALSRRRAGFVRLALVALSAWSCCGSSCISFGAAPVAATMKTDASKPALSQAIDRLISAGGPGLQAAQADDAEFLRRVYLDLAGRTPTVVEARTFLTDKAGDKRTALVDRLLASPEFPTRMTEAFNAMLMERRGEHDEWRKFLTTSFQKNAPWDAIVREIIDPRDNDENLRGAAFFAVNRLSKVGQQETDYPGLTRDVGRLFLGMDLQCAQCHNHLFVESYKQVDFQGLYTVFLNTSIRDEKFPALNENLMAKKIDFMSVFDKQPLQTGPRVPGLKEISIPTFKAGEEYLVAPDKKKKVLGIPKFSPLEELAKAVTSPENRSFRENIANRLWWLVMGRGIVDPLDLFHAENKPSHPEVLALLSTEMQTRKFEMRSILRDLVLSDTYARGSRWTATEIKRPAPETYVTAVAKPLSAEQMYNSYLTATGPHDPKTATPDLRKRFITAFANPPKEPEVEFAPSVKGALFLSNDSNVLELLVPKSGNLVDRLGKISEPDALADELYLAVFTRTPTADERAEVRRLLGMKKIEKTKLLGHLVWALTSSTEFCLNH
ncbi:MAG: DUF1549 and DUF1553 domain-containing protein [Planctomycetia bacterium]|nr:DUF1549 and DUF1553 domain-containing protein [Planctomycetia bacterium]